MLQTPIKICGITNKTDANMAVSLGAHALGFVFYKKSPRSINPAEAESICATLPGNISKIGVVVNANEGFLNKLSKMNFLDYFQFHGDEPPERCNQFKGKAIKVFRVDDTFDVLQVNNFADCAMFLFDTKVRNVYGGSGKSFDWSILQEVPRTHSIILSGGLNEHNVAEAVRNVNPYMVDVSSAVESKPGQKDSQKIKRFIAACAAV